MVCAEIPLWMTHGTEAGKDPSASTQTNQATQAAAIASLGLWRKDRAAVYGIHVHPVLPQLVATAGGDGTVRLWSTATLFQGQGGKFQKPTAENKAGYVSTSSGSGGDDDEDKMSTDSIDSNNHNDNNNHEQTPPPRPVIHDLNNVVRSRKHPEASPERPSQAAAAATSVQAKTTKNNNNNNHTTTPNHQRLICTLTAHTGSSVLAVRFSSTGKLLASAGDDGCVCLYAPDQAEALNTAPWHRILLCRGHQLDAVGLAWSPDDHYLVSVSLDRETPVLVWHTADVAADGQAPAGSMIRSPHKCLGREAHQSTVKGVCFDPVGSYLATSGDDPAVCLWRTHGDWGLEKRIDAKDGIFRQWGQGMPLSSQSLFRRLSWSTDGMHILATNATVKNKHVASTISREQWATTTAHLVGHKQPVVVACHAPVLLAGDETSDDPDEEPSYATLVALGDKKGFVTIWSTRKSRPLFKLQCSEGRSTVTDMSWGVAADHLLLAVGLLDGHVVMLKLGIPDEVGRLLPPADQAKLFRLRYGIDTNDPSSYGRLMDDGRPKLIETALQLTLEDEQDDDDEDEEEVAQEPAPARAVHQLTGRSKTKDGKKRVQPVLMTTQKKTAPPAKRVKTSTTPVNALEHAQQIAEKAAAAAKTTSPLRNVTMGGPVSPPASPVRLPPHAPAVVATTGVTASVVALPYSTERVHTVELPLEPGLMTETPVRWTAECHNRPSQVPMGSKGTSLPCLDVTLCRDGRPVWQDQIVGTSCSALAGNAHVLAVGCTDGCIQLYGASPLHGWRSETALRAFPPLVLGHPIVALEIKVWQGSPSLLVVTADGSFGVYRLQPTLGKVLTGSVLPALTHMANTTLQGDKILPNLSRCQLTDKGQILLLLSSSAAAAASLGGEVSTTVGGSVQGFVYHCDLELWLRISDSRFVLSDFYSSLPLRQTSETGPLKQLDDSVRLGAMEAALKPSQRRRHDTSTANIMYKTAEVGNFVPTKAHCEDRMACAIALNSPHEFRQWLKVYAKTLVAGGQENLLRTLVDILLGTPDDGGWWLSIGLDSLGLDRKALLKKVVLPAMSKNRALQRLTNELAVELGAGDA